MTVARQVEGRRSEVEVRLRAESQKLRAVVSKRLPPGPEPRLPHPWVGGRAG